MCWQAVKWDSKAFSQCGCNFINIPVAFWDSAVIKGLPLILEAGAECFANHGSLSCCRETASPKQRKRISRVLGFCCCTWEGELTRILFLLIPLRIPKLTLPTLTQILRPMWHPVWNNNGLIRQDLGTALWEMYHHTSNTSSQFRTF